MAVILFIGAHQDDETLLMGAGVINHKNVGHKVYHTVITDGMGATEAAAAVGLGIGAFGWYRDQELISALSFMQCLKIEAAGGRMADGTLNPNQYKGNDLRTGHVNMTVVARVRSAITLAAQAGGVNYGDVCVRTHSYNDPHPDHMAVCGAVLYLRNLGEINQDVKLYVHVNCWYGAFGAAPSAATLGAWKETCPLPIPLRDALLAYCAPTTLLGVPGAQYPGTAQYGCGHASALTLFDIVWAGNCSYTYNPPAVIL